MLCVIFSAVNVNALTHQNWQIPAKELMQISPCEGLLGVNALMQLKHVKAVITTKLIWSAG